MKINLANIRQEYAKGGLKVSDMPDNPLPLFEKWLNENIQFDWVKAEVVSDSPSKIKSKASKIVW